MGRLLFDRLRYEGRRFHAGGPALLSGLGFAESAALIFYEKTGGFDREKDYFIFNYYYHGSHVFCCRLCRHL
jgi:hypothetical protein